MLDARRAASPLARPSPTRSSVSPARHTPRLTRGIPLVPRTLAVDSPFLSVESAESAPALKRGPAIQLDGEHFTILIVRVCISETV